MSREGGDRRAGADQCVSGGGRGGAPQPGGSYSRPLCSHSSGGRKPEADMQAGLSPPGLQAKGLSLPCPADGCLSPCPCSAPFSVHLQSHASPREGPVRRHRPALPSSPYRPHLRGPFVRSWRVALPHGDLGPDTIHPVTMGIAEMFIIRSAGPLLG